MDAATRVTQLIEPALTDMGFDLVRVLLSGKARPVLQIMAEPSDGRQMTVEHCADISRAVSAILDVEDPISSAYTLEVSSPGLDRPLVRERDFQRYAGFEARVEMATPVDGRRRFTGRMNGMNDDDVLVTDDAGTEWRLPFATIHRAKLLLTDELIAATEEQRSDD